MFWRNLWLKVPLLLAVVGQAELFEALTHRQPPWWQVGIAFTIGAVVTPLLGEWLAEDATTVRWRRVGWTLAAGGALGHLLLDAACIALPWVAPAWRIGLAGALVGALIMALLLRRYLSALRHPLALAPPPWIPSGDGWLARVWRGASQLGGTAIMLTIISLAFVAAALIGLIGRPEARLDWRLWLALLFFAGCALVGVWMGLERRALLQRLPSPISFRWLRWRRTTCTATSDGLLCVDRRGATLYPWDAIASVSAGTIFDNAAVFVDLAPDVSPDRIDGNDASDRLVRELRQRGFNRSFYGADLVILGARLGRPRDLRRPLRGGVPVRRAQPRRDGISRRAVRRAAPGHLPRRRLDRSDRGGL